MSPKLHGFDFYEKSLRGARYVVAPMVDASELAWRMLARKYRAELCYTPMLHSAVFVRDPKYRRDNLVSCPEDRPLIVQFCANDPEIFCKAVELTLAEFECDAIDLNLGCPQVIARRGHFGSFLQDEWDLLKKMISAVHEKFDIPITCKIRVFEDIDKTVQYAKMLESAGAQLLTVHGRTREQKGPLTGIASWKHIEAVRKSVSIPVFANGNIQYLEDVHRCIKETGVQGVMSAEGHLTNPAIFAGINPPVWQMGLEYLDLVDRYPCPISFVRGHIFKLMHHVLQIKSNFDLRDVIAKTSSLSDFRDVLLKMKSRYEEFHNKTKLYENPPELSCFNLSHPPWICQPYVRPRPEEYVKKMQEMAATDALKRRLEHTSKEGSPGQGMSKRKLKKLERNPKLKDAANSRKDVQLCKDCKNPSSSKCVYDLCRSCCKDKCFKLELDCSGHKILVKTRRETARAFENEKKNLKLTEPIHG